MEMVGFLGGAAPDQLKKKRFGGVTGGIRADSGLKRLDDKRRERICMQGQVMKKSWMNSLGFVT